MFVEDLADHDGAFDAGVLDDLPDGGLKRAQHDVDAGLDVGIVGRELADRRLGAQQSRAAAGNDAFFDGRLGGVHGIVDAILLLLDLDLGRAADADDRDAACELGEALLELLTVVVRGGLLDLRLDLRDAGFDVLLLAGAVDDRGVFLLDADALGAAEHVEGDVLELDAEVFRDDLAGGEDGDVLEHGLAAVAEARSLDGGDLQAAAQLVDDEGRERLALDVLGDDEQRLAGLHDGFEDRQQACSDESFFSWMRM